MCYLCRDQMNSEIQQIIEQVKQISVDEHEMLIFTETDLGAEISKIKTIFADQLALEKYICIKT